MASAQAVRKSRSDKTVVAAIDFGTTYSGYAFSFRHDYETEPPKVNANPSWVAGGNLMSLKTPTALLLDANQTFVAFGYAAEDQYGELAADEEHGEYYYFRRFKMSLHEKEVCIRDFTCSRAEGLGDFKYCLW